MAQQQHHQHHQRQRHHHHHDAPAASWRGYAVIYVLLLLMTGLTLTLALRARLGVWEVPVALGIATVKTVLVALFFMHLNHSTRLTWLVVMAGVLFLGVMLVLTLADYWTRDWLPTPGQPETPIVPRAG